MNQALYAKALGDLILRYEEHLSPAVVAEQVESNALSLLAEIKSILDDESLTDPECFYKIDEIVMAFYRAGISTDRHWEAD